MDLVGTPQIVINRGYGFEYRIYSYTVLFKLKKLLVVSILIYLFEN